MQLVRVHDKVVAWAPAKVNLFLEVLSKRPDGYHDIATLMVAVRWFDTLVFTEEPTGQVCLGCNRPDLSTGPDNLIIRAAQLLRERTGFKRGARIRLVKRIPLAAGLAGGSSDAAATLAGLNNLWRLGLGNDALAKLGGEVGSDVPFFFHTPAAWCIGRGEIVSPRTLGKALDLVLLCPAFGMATAQVYARVDPTLRVGQFAHCEEIQQALAAGDIEGIGRLLFNRLQPAAEGIAPELADYYRLLARFQPAGQLMSGSGSTLFALCRDRREAERLAAQLRPLAKERFTVYVVRSCV
ncbi:MAG: 4-(cytidine 5'-diphospho)-2-C-methyl-D-erythritol kinase [Gemmataceae bacterium]|nr:4-(cytidine 5'-diphospho)-2-C-methyl-D-erythritol kinase [Gemmataceae bacterium]MCI0742838.1 4-(cytidine 5'-diphospho)-2-C-methyl-D-erythritol kinase [Gemmataceae bacterium]